MVTRKAAKKAAMKAELSNKAQKFMQKSQWAKALDHMLQAHKLDETDPMIALRIGDLHKKLGKNSDAANFYFKTANIFAEQGHTTKAAATYKMILRIDPSLEEVQEKLDELKAQERETSSTRIKPVSKQDTKKDTVDVAPPQVAPPHEEAPDVGLSGDPSDPPPIEQEGYSDEPPPLDDSGYSDEPPPLDDSGYSDEPPPLDDSGYSDEPVPMEGSSFSSEETNDEPGPAAEEEGYGNISFGSGPDDTDDSYGDIDFGSDGSSFDGDDFEIEPAGATGESLSPYYDSELGEGLTGCTDSISLDPNIPIGEGSMPDELAPAVGSGDGSPLESLNEQPRIESEIFLGIGEEDLWDLLGSMDRLTFGPGEDIIREGDKGDSIFIVSDGRVSVSTTMNGKVVQLGELGEQDFFGEVSFLTGMPRTATVTAVDPTVIMELKRSEVDGLIEKNPEIRCVLKMFHQNRVADTISTMKSVSKGLF